MPEKPVWLRLNLVLDFRSSQRDMFVQYAALIWRLRQRDFLLLFHLHRGGYRDTSII